MLNSKFSPTNKSQYSATDLIISFTGKSFDVTKNASTMCDHKVLDDSMVDGGRIIATNVVAGDKITCQVIDKEYVYAGILYPADYNGIAWNIAQPNGVVLREFIKDWYLTPGINLQWDFQVDYPAKILGNMYVRVIYDSIGTENDVKLFVNYKLHKVLW